MGSHGLARRHRAKRPCPCIQSLRGGALTYPVLRSHQILKLFAEKGHFPVDVIDLVAQGLWDDAGDCVVGGHR